MNPSYPEFKARIEEALDPKFTVDVEQIRTWTSMQSLIAVSAIDEHYDVLITYEDLASVSTLQELHDVVQRKTR